MKTAIQIQKLAYQRSKAGVMTRIYSNQRSASKKRGHHLPKYSKQKLSEWLLNDWVFNLIYNNWVNCGYLKSMSPSVDRIEDSKGYILSNIQIMTWGENKAKSHYDSLTKLETNPKRKVGKFKDNILIDTYISISEAERENGINPTGLNRVLSTTHRNRQRKTAKGFNWSYV